MLATYTESIGGGLVLFLVCAAVLLPVIAATQYARHGRLRPRRLLVHGGFLLYGSLAIALVFLPLPESPDACYPGQTFQPTPLQWTSDIRREMGELGTSALGTPAALQLAFNVALFVPFGFALRRMYGRRPRTVLAAGLGTSLLIEITQLTGNFGAYACPYRIGDVDDLMANTTGVALGCLLASAIIRLRRAPRPVAGATTPVPYPAAVSVPHPATVPLPQPYAAGPYAGRSYAARSYTARPYPARRPAHREPFSVR